jgi:lysophosphatidate acyltransferase
MFYLRFVCITLWLFICFGTGFIACLFRWGDINLNRYTAQMFGRGALWLLGIRVDVENLGELTKHQPCVYVANHQGALDIPTFGSFYPANTVVIAKKEISYIPILNLYFVAAGNILVDRQKRTNAVASLSKAVATVKKRGASIWIFAEGTRNRTDQVMLPLKKGAFHMAVETQVPIVPIVSAPIKTVFDRKAKHLVGGTLKMKVLPPISTVGLTSADVDRLAEQTRNQMIEAIHSLVSV